MLYKAKTVMAVAGLNRGKFDAWLSKGIIVPTKVPKRSGDRAGFDFDDIMKINIICYLADHGVSLAISAQLAREMVFEQLHSYMDEHLQEPEDLWAIINLDNPLENAILSVVSHPLPYPFSIILDLSRFFRLTWDALKTICLPGRI